METVFQEAFELKLKPTAVATHEYMPRVYEVNLPCQWLTHCNDGKCPAFTRLNGNFYCARKNTH
jgi:hypothetical protein